MNHPTAGTPRFPPPAVARSARARGAGLPQSPHLGPDFRPSAANCVPKPARQPTPAPPPPARTNLFSTRWTPRRHPSSSLLCPALPDQLPFLGPPCSWDGSRCPFSGLRQQRPCSWPPPPVSAWRSLLHGSGGVTQHHVPNKGQAHSCT